MEVHTNIDFFGVGTFRNFISYTYETVFHRVSQNRSKNAYGTEAA